MRELSIIYCCTILTYLRELSIIYCCTILTYLRELSIIYCFTILTYLRELSIIYCCTILTYLRELSIIYCCTILTYLRELSIINCCTSLNLSFWCFYLCVYLSVYIIGRLDMIFLLYTYFRAYIHLRFKHAVLGSELVGFISLLVVNEREEHVVALHLPIGTLETALGWSRYRDANLGYVIG